MSTPISTLASVDRSQMSVADIFDELVYRIGDYTPAFELRVKAELAVEINQLKRQRNAVILGHNYMEPALFHSVPDFVGDSLDLSRKAAQRPTRTSSSFAASSSWPRRRRSSTRRKTVLIPSLQGRLLAGREHHRRRRRAPASERFPGVPVVTYVNTYADVKAESDICCTSGNAVAVVESLGTDRVIFLPDEYLAANVARETGKHIIFPSKYPGGKMHDASLDYQMIGWHGRCEVHEKFTVDDIERCAPSSPTW